MKRKKRPIFEESPTDSIVSMTGYAWKFAGCFIVFSLVFGIIIGLLLSHTQFAGSGIAQALAFVSSMLSAIFVCRRFYQRYQRRFTKREYRSVIIRGSLVSFSLIFLFTILVLSVLVFLDNTINITPLLVMLGVIIIIGFPLQWLTTWIGFNIAVRHLARYIESPSRSSSA